MRRVAFFAILVFIGSIPLQMAYYEMQAYAGSVPRLIGIVAAIVGFAAFVFEGRFRRITWAQGIAFAFLCWACLSFVWSVNPDSTYARVFTAAQLGIMLWLMNEYGQKESESRTIALAYILGAFIPIGQVIYRYLTGYALGGRAVSQMLYARYAAFSEDPNELALGFVVGLPLAWYLVGKMRGWVRLVAMAYFPASVIGIALTASRGGAIAGAVALLVIPLSFANLERRVRWITLGALAAAIPLVLATIPQSTIERVGTMVDFFSENRRYVASSISEMDVRWNIWEEGMRAYVDSPLLGVGLGAFPDATRAVNGERRVAHSVWISTLTETGLIGFSMWLSIFVFLLLGLRRFDPFEAKVLLLFMLSWAVGASFLTVELSKTSWFVISLVGARVAAVNLQFRRHRKRVLAERMRSFRYGSVSPVGPLAVEQQ